MKLTLIGDVLGKGENGQTGAETVLPSPLLEVIVSLSPKATSVQAASQAGMTRSSSASSSAVEAWVVLLA